MRVNTTPRVKIDPDLTRELRDHATLINLMTDGRLAGTNNAQTAAPTTGTHAQGDYVKNSAPSGSTPVIGWVCTVGGTPGTWVDVMGGAGSGSGTVTSVALSAPAGFSVAGSPVTTTGTLALSYSAGYSLPTTAKQSEWDTAYGWGNHASAGYATTAAVAAGYQPLDADLTSWAGVTRAAGFDAFAATPSSANLRTLLSDEVGTGAAYFVGGALGTPASGTLTSCTGLPINTGVSGLAANVATFLATPTSANLAAALTDESGTGAALFAGGNIGAATGTSLAVTGKLSSSGTDGVGYAAGAGGTVTQSPNKGSGVTLNKTCGEITMSNAALAAATIVSFTLTNSTIAATDVLVLNHVTTGTRGAYGLNAQCAAGSALIYVRNNSAGSLSEAIVIRFAVVKAVTA